MNVKIKNKYLVALPYIFFLSYSINLFSQNKFYNFDSYCKDCEFNITVGDEVHMINDTTFLLFSFENRNLLLFNFTKDTIKLKHQLNLSKHSSYFFCFNPYNNLITVNSQPFKSDSSYIYLINNELHILDSFFCKKNIAICYPLNSKQIVAVSFLPNKLSIIENHSFKKTKNLNLNFIPRSIYLIPKLKNNNIFSFNNRTKYFNKNNFLFDDSNGLFSVTNKFIITNTEYFHPLIYDIEQNSISGQQTSYNTDFYITKKTKNNDVLILQLGTSYLEFYDPIEKTFKNRNNLNNYTIIDGVVINDKIIILLSPTSRKNSTIGVLDFNNKTATQPPHPSHE